MHIYLTNMIHRINYFEFIFHILFKNERKRTIRKHDNSISYDTLVLINFDETLRFERSRFFFFFPTIHVDPEKLFSNQVSHYSTTPWITLSIRIDKLVSPVSKQTRLIRIQ